MDSFSTDSWLFLLEVPYFDLTRKQRVHVRHVLQSVYALDVVERIVSVAEQHNMSAVDAVSVVRAQVTSQPEVFVQRKAVRAPVEKAQAAPRVSSPKKKATRTNAAYVFSQQNTAYSFTHEEEVFVLARTVNETMVMTTANSVIAMKKAN